MKKLQLMVSKKLKLKRKITLNSSSKEKFIKYNLNSSRFLSCIKIISNSVSYSSGMGLPKDTDFKEINNRLSQNAKDYWIEFVSKRNPKIIKIKIIGNKAVLFLKGYSPDYNSFLIFEDKDGKNYESNFGKIEEKKKIRRRNRTRTEIPQKVRKKQKGTKRTISNVSSKKLKRKN